MRNSVMVIQDKKSLNFIGVFASSVCAVNESRLCKLTYYTVKEFYLQYIMSQWRK